MQKFHFTSLGFDALQKSLYQKSDVQLEDQAKQINQDFIQWLQNNFELNIGQVDHLKTLAADALFKLSSQTSIAIRGRLPVTLIKPEIKPVVGYDSKLIVPTSMVRELATLDDEFEAEGELIIQISY